MSEAVEVEQAQVGLQFSLYPLRQAHVRPAIEAAVEVAAGEGVAVRSAGEHLCAAAGDSPAMGTGSRRGPSRHPGADPRREETVAEIQGARVRCMGGTRRRRASGLKTLIPARSVRNSELPPSSDRSVPPGACSMLAK